MRTVVETAAAVAEMLPTFVGDQTSSNSFESYSKPKLALSCHQPFAVIQQPVCFASLQVGVVRLVCRGCRSEGSVISRLTILCEQ